MLMVFRQKKSAGKQKGQAFPIGLAFIAFSVLLIVVLFNSGVLISEKTKLSNTADAAAYSGLVWQARALNFNSYTNRAMVANQVSIAQLVSINSWTQYGNIVTRNANSTIGLIPPLRVFTEAIHGVMTEINEIVNMVADIAIPVIDGVLQVLSQTQRAVYMATFAITPAVVNEVVRANDPNFDVETVYAIASMAENALEWRNFLTRYDDEGGLLRKADIINRSRDRFTRDRGWDVGKFYLAPTQRVELIKEGTTQLIYNPRSEEWAWMGKDTQSLHVENFRCSWRGCRWRHRETPIGWGAAYSPEEERCRRVRRRNHEAGFRYQNDCHRFRRHNRRAERLANNEQVDVGDYGGVQAYYDLTDLSAENRDPRINLRIEVQMRDDDLRTSTNIGLASTTAPNRDTTNNGLGQGVFWADDEVAADSMAAISMGELFFERPTYESRYQLRVRGRVQHEYGSLYNPYWQVRLIETPREYKLAAWALRSPDLVTGAAQGVVSGVVAYTTDQFDDLLNLQQLQTYAEQEVAQIDAYATSQNLLSSQININTQDIQNLEQEIHDLEAAGAAEDVINQRRYELQQVALEQSGLNAELQQVAAALDQAEALEQQLVTIQDQIDSTQDSIENADIAAVSEFTGDLGPALALAGSISQDGLSGFTDQLMEQGQEQLENAIEEQLSEMLEEMLSNAVESIISAYAGDYEGYVNQAEEYSDNIQENAGQFAEDIIAPIEAQIAEMRESLDAMRAEVEREVYSAVALMNEQIDQVRDQIDMRVAGVEDRLRQERDTLIMRRDALVDAAEIQAVQQQIETVEARLLTEPQELRAQVQSQLATLVNRRDEMAAGVEDRIAEAEGSLTREIARLEERIEDIRRRT